VKVDNHWHVTAASVHQQQQKRIAAFLNVGSGSLTPVKLEHKNGWQKASTTLSDGRAEIWVNMDPGASMPTALQTIVPHDQTSALVVGIWYADDEAPQVLTNQSQDYDEDHQ
jgi:hypothetical protein